MLSNLSLSKTIVSLAICTVLISGHALADSDQHSGDSQEDYKEHNEALNRSSLKHFDDARRESVRNYYVGKQGKSGKSACPPGLAKKNNGCLPPGQAKKWELGHSLQAGIVYDSLPQDLLSLLGRPPAGEHYGMIDSDILLLANGTELVLEVIAALSQ